MLTADLINEIKIPAFRSCLQRTLDAADTVDDKSRHLLTACALVGLFRRLDAAPVPSKLEPNPLRARLAHASTLYFGPMYLKNEPEDLAFRDRRVAALAEAGFVTEHLVFLNASQVELLFSYARESGLVRTR